ncbi:ligase-associated DNA damage response DEXH box helicase [Rhodoligotrophos defluvii]|uniref:ligase-associated DNA damage response DEXH box helicase n=1 Tax=Rhodoligotrophos defluvii TaxID=2561934 RepID=UPI0010C9775E|nr:ligase-associated DNA damage response DEXH box helicase [Rhodoligotrophos defluvii]
MSAPAGTSGDALIQSGREALPPRFARWFTDQGWSPRPHQLELLAHGLTGRSALLIAPTGGGKTLAGFLPSLVELAGEDASTRKARFGPHTLYISPLKALAVDVARNLERPVREMALPIQVETRTGDTPQSKRQRQRMAPPDILMTTPEQLALLIALPDAARLFSGLRAVVLDELHAMVASKRGVLLALGLARLGRLAPQARRIGLSATVAEPDRLRAWLMPQPSRDELTLSALVMGGKGADPDISILRSEERVPWAGHSARYAMADLYQAIRDAGMTLVFVNTRSQAEMIFQELWHINEDNLPIALHHGSLDVAQRRRVEAAMAEGRLRAVVCTSTLDLGIDWGDVDLVINVGAPKGASRLLQRIGRANHRLDDPSRALLVPANRFEVLECQAAKAAAAEGQQDTQPPMLGKLDVLAQHVLGSACAEPFDPDVLYDEVRSSYPYRRLTRADFDAVVDFVATGGYALRSYERYAKLRRQPDGRFRISHPKVAQQYRLNVGTIVEAAMLRVRLVSRRGRGKGVVSRGGRVLGEVEEWFIEQLSPGDTFVFAGQVLRFEGLDELDALVTRAEREDPKIPSYEGGKFPLSTYLAERVRNMLSRPDDWRQLPDQVRDWLSVQRFKSVVPKADEMLVETFPRGSRWYLVCYPFEGRLAHQTLGMLLTRRLDRMRARPLGFVANEYALAVWGTRDLALMISAGKLPLGRLFDEDMLGDDLDAWLAESNLMKRTFRTCAIIAGLIERRHPGQEKSGRQVTFSSDLIYDVLRQHEPRHVLLRAAWDDAAEGLLDIRRLGALLRRIKGHIVHRPLETVSPLAVPVMLEIGREQIYGEAHEALLAEAADALIEEAMRLV